MIFGSELTIMSDKGPTGLAHVKLKSLSTALQYIEDMFFLLKGLLADTLTVPILYPY